MDRTLSVSWESSEEKPLAELPDKVKPLPELARFCDQIVIVSVTIGEEAPIDCAGVLIKATETGEWLILRHRPVGFPSCEKGHLRSAAVFAACREMNNGLPSRVYRPPTQFARI